MIRHIVMWKFLDNAEGHTKAENIEFMRENLTKLADKLSIIKRCEFGVNDGADAKAFDAVLVLDVESREDLAAYKTNPEHMKISAYCKKVRSDRAVVDYNI